MNYLKSLVLYKYINSDTLINMKHKVKQITEDRLLLSTSEAARLLGYAEQTLRKWALYENGPINPIRHGRSLRTRQFFLLLMLIAFDKKKTCNNKKS